MSNFTRTTAGWLAGLALAIAMVALVGHAIAWSELYNLRSGLAAMSPVTALLMAAVAAASIARQRRTGRLSTGLAAVTLVGALLVLFSYLLTGADQLNPLLARLAGSIEPAGKTSVGTALGLSALGGSLLAHRRPALRDGLAGVALVISGVALLGYLYGVRDLYALPVFQSMALNTALAIFFVGGSVVLASRNGWGATIAAAGASGRTTRRLLAFTLLPPALGFALVTAEHRDAMGSGAAMALLVVCTIVPLLWLVLRDGRALDLLERTRAEKAELERSRTSELGEKLAAQAIQLEKQTEQRLKTEAALARAQRMEAVGHLTGGIAHDFNNLLMAVGGNLQLLERRLDEDHPGRRFVANAIKAIDRGSKLTGQLLAFSRSQKLEIRPVALDPGLSVARELIGESLGPSIRIEMALAAAGDWASADRAQLELAILNLVLNARDAMPDGGTIRIESGSCMARLDEDIEERAFLAVRVIDTGTGMTADEAAHAVEPFFTTKPRGQGTGLGLAQVYGFVRQCGGDVRIVTAPGEGTTIEMLLPRTEAPSVEDDVAVSSAPSMPGDARHQILVIDDDDGVRGVILDALSAVGFSVVEANSGEAGLAMLAEHRPALAVIDFIMPGLNGAETALRARKLYPSLPILFVSGYSDTVALDGISDAMVLRKPFDVDGLHRAITAALH